MSFKEITLKEIGNATSFTRTSIYNYFQTKEEIFLALLQREYREDFLYSFFPFMFGIYPYAVVTEKQKKAMEQAGVNYEYRSIYEITYTEVKKLLSKIN